MGLNWLDYGWRNYDPAIGRFNKVDRFAEKYYDKTTYGYAGNNPIVFVDIQGDSLDVGQNKQSIKDINSLVKSGNKKYLNFNSDGSLTLDFSSLKKNQNIADILKEDEGLNLLNQLISSEQNFLFESSDVFLGKDEAGNKIGIEMWRDNNGVVNASEGGCDSAGGLTFRPKDGYSGQVVIANNVSFEEVDSNGYQVNKPRSSVVFHELAENYERTQNNINYSGTNGAHAKAITREKNWSGKSSSPGAFSGIRNPKPSKAKRKANYQTIKDYTK